MCVLSLIIGGCQTTPQQHVHHGSRAIVPGERIKIGVMLPLTGPHSKIGLDLQRATTLSLLESGAQNIALLYRDTQGVAEHAIVAAKELMQDKVHLIIGPLFSGTTAAVHNLLRREGVPILSFSSDFAIAGGGVYLMGFDPAEQMRQIILYGHVHHKRDPIILVPEGPLVERAEVALAGLHSRGVADGAKIIHYKKGDIEGLKALAERLKTLRFTTLLLPDGQAAVSIVSSLLYYHVHLKEVQLLGSAQWHGKELSKDPNFFNALYPAPNDKDRRAFESRFEMLMGHPPHRLASLAYDAVAMVTTLAQRYPEQPYSLMNLTHETGFLGLDGLFRFLGSGTNERGLSIYEVTPAGIKERQASPRKFRRR